MYEVRAGISASTDYIFPDGQELFFVLFFFFKIFSFSFFGCRSFLKSSLNLLQYSFCFMLCFFGHKACGILAHQPGIEPAPTALEGKVLTPGPTAKSLFLSSNLLA